MFNGSLWIANILLQSTIDSKTTHENNKQTPCQTVKQHGRQAANKQTDSQTVNYLENRQQTNIQSARQQTTWKLNNKQIYSQLDNKQLGN